MVFRNEETSDGLLFLRRVGDSLLNRFYALRLYASTHPMDLETPCLCAPTSLDGYGFYNGVGVVEQVLSHSGKCRHDTCSEISFDERDVSVRRH